MRFGLAEAQSRVVVSVNAATEEVLLSKTATLTKLSSVSVNDIKLPIITGRHKQLEKQMRQCDRVR
jgi:hypothetical protein